ncbi:MAG: diacylglycerol kinase family protein [Actinomycetota bacterium]|nr:diacylglycerol kinase family protein [Actinomycetota bacterium]
MRILAIVNTKAGLGDAGLYEFLRVVGTTGAEITLRFMVSGSTTKELVRDADEFDRVIAAGGDGTVSSVCYALRDVDVPILAYPAGTANLLALNLMMPLEPAELARIALSDCTVDLDLGELVIGLPGDPARRREGFVIAAGAGFDASIMESAQELKGSIGVAAYLVAAFQNLTPTVSHFTLELDGETIHTEGIAVLIANVARLQFDLTITHESHPADGKFEVVVVRTRNALELLPAVWTAIVDRTTGLRPAKTAGLDVHSASVIRIEADPPLPVQFDGEITSECTPLEVRVLPRRARLLVSKSYRDILSHDLKKP